MKRLALVLLVVACGSSRPTAQPPLNSESPAKPADSPALVEGNVDSADGIEISYDVRGRGDTALVFVHCWSCDRTYWKEQVDAFANDYRVVTLDLGGHGKSGDARSAWTIASLGADVQAVIDKLGLTRVILVGHSMGGPVSLEAARRMPGKVAGIVCADTLHDASMKMPAAMRDQILASFEKDFAGTMKEGLKIMFRPSSDPAVVAWVGERAANAKPAVGLPLIRELWNIELGPMLAAAKVPIRCINAASNGPMAPKTNVLGNKQHADFDAVIIADVGHFLQLEKPAEFNAKLREVLATWKK